MKKVFSIISLFFILIIVACSGDKVKVTFNYNYNNISEVVKINRGSKVSYQNNHPRDSYTLAQWLLNGVEYDFELNVDADITLVAKWVSSAETTDNLTADLNAVKNQFDNKTIDDINLNLPTTGANGTKFTYTSSNPSVVTNNGYVINPSIDDGNKVVSITVNAKLGSLTETTTINVIIPAVTYSEDVTNKKDLAFKNTSSEFSIESNTLTTYFVSNGALPFVDIEDFFSLLSKKDSSQADNLNPLFHGDEIEYQLNNQVLSMSYTVGYEGADDEEYAMTLDFLDNTITIDSFDFFSGYLQQTGTDYADKLSYLPSYSEAGNQVVFDLDRYNIDIFIYNDNKDTQYLVPFHLVNLLFTYNTYYNVYYNVDQFYGLYAYPEDDVKATIKDSSVTNDELPYDISLATYHYTAFTFDYLYGLKDIKGVDSYYDVLANYTNSLLSTNSYGVSNAIYRFIYKTIDELHSSFTFYGNYVKTTQEPPAAYINEASIRGPYVINWSKSYIAISNAFKNKFPQGTPNFKILDNKSAIIYLDSFDTATLDDPNGLDSDRFMEETLKAIFDLNPNIENIVLDISQNGGGNIGALFRVLGYMSEQPIEVSYMNPTDGSKLTYFVEVSTNAYDVNWYVLTSEITFSAANLLAAIAKNQGIATIIGSPSFGGASSITPIVLPDGTMISISSLNVLSVRSANDDGTYTYNHIEFGITPDYLIPISNLYTDSYIIAAIND